MEEVSCGGSELWRKLAVEEVSCGGSELWGETKIEQKKNTFK